MGYSDKVTKDSTASVSQNEDVAARDEKGAPAFLREATKGQAAPLAPAAGYEDANLPRFLREDADQTQVIGHLVGAAEHSPAMQEYEGAPRGGTSSEAFKSTSSDAKARHERNMRDLAKKGDLIDTTYHTDVE